MSKTSRQSMIILRLHRELDACKKEVEALKKEQEAKQEAMKDHDPSKAGDPVVYWTGIENGCSG